MIRSSVYRNAALKNTKAGVKDAPGSIFGMSVINLDAAIAYLQLYDSKLADVTVGTTVPTLTFPIKASDVFHLWLPTQGESGLFMFQTGMVVASTLAADGSGAAPTNGVLITAAYA